MNYRGLPSEIDFVYRTNLILTPDSKRVICRFFSIGETRTLLLWQQIMELDEKTVRNELEFVLASFAGRHKDVKEYFLLHFLKAERIVRKAGNHTGPLSEEKMLLTGSYFTYEYSLEAAALFNPSILVDPDQNGLQNGQIRLIMSLRAAGEGHISSMEFRQLIVDNDGMVNATASSKHLIVAEKIEEGAEGTEMDYRITFPHGSSLNERVIFPYASWESNGMEDVRWVQFRHENGEAEYLATYTAYDGHQIRPKMMQTHDFKTITIKPLFGQGASNKNLAFFPRKIKGQFVMLSRIDGRSNYIQFSDSLQHWDDPKLLSEPTYPWEMVQTGNCGSPLETPDGWLVITHGVGPMRKYCLGATLLDLEDPSIVIGQLSSPLLCPNEHEREGYVPNVLYSCGSVILDDKILLPYAASDQLTTAAWINLDPLLEALKSRLS